MKSLIEIKRPEEVRERAFLAGVSLPSEPEHEIREQIKELSMLAETAGAQVMGKIIQSRPAPDSAYYIGSGCAAEMAAEIKRTGADLAIFNDDLSPRQIRNLEKLLEVRTIDRSMLILDIFGRHARTHESKVQVELAQMSYLSPRLTRLWTHLGQQVGHGGVGGRIGTRGPGEKQLETDRRLVKKRIQDLKERLEKIAEERRTQKKRRENIFRASIVGYTNVGKSSILNVLSKGGVLVANKLFATLDATTRRVYIAPHGEILMSDTVGFIRKLPHHLVASFKSTLEVITDSDLIITVMDASSLDAGEHQEVVNTVLNDLDTMHVERLMVFNKIDLTEPGLLERLKTLHPEAVFISAAEKTGFDELKKKVAAMIQKRYPSKQKDEWS